MRVDELQISDSIKEALMKQGFINLHPPQAEALPKALEGRNLVVSVPTAGGKSLIGYIAALQMVLTQRRKVLYIVPLKALASEKKDDLDAFSEIGVTTALSIGDLDSEDRYLDRADIIVATSEKADSLLRHGNRWMDDLGMVIADEIHMLHDPLRGPTLEVALTKLMLRGESMQTIALSATASNAWEMAQWLKAELILSDWRPVPLKEGVYCDGTIHFTDGTQKEIDPKKDGVLALIEDAISSGGQCLVFVNSRRSTESLAFNYRKDIAVLSNIALNEVETALIEGEAESTSLGRKLSACVSCGIAFHHAGLTSSQRRFVESNFKNGRIKCIVATPTLAAGINLPARRVIVRDTARFGPSGYTPIPVMEIKQMCGRAGRPGYDPYGEAVLIAKKEGDEEYLTTEYLESDTENITSKLGNEVTLRTHILGLVSAGDVSSIDDIIQFLRRSFFGTQSELYGVEEAVENVVDYLIENGMIIDDGNLSPSPFGKRVSDLYIDPVSAVMLKEAVERMNDNTDDLLILHAVASTPDVLGLYPKSKEREDFTLIADKFEGQFLVDYPDDQYSIEYFYGDLKTALLASSWIEETDENTITESMGIGPGDIRSRMDSMEWLMYAMSEIALLDGISYVKRIRSMLTRIKYGVKEELLDLVSLNGVGRARARILFNNGVVDRSSVIEKGVGFISNIPNIGGHLARSIVEQCGGNVIEKPMEEKKKVASAKPKQPKLTDY